VTHDDHVALENVLQETKNTDVMREEAQAAPAPTGQHPEGELKLKRSSVPSPDSFSVPGADSQAQADFDEIYIDVRGRLHHRAEDEPATTQKPADKPQA
jgi:hypothetical protein